MNRVKVLLRSIHAHVCAATWPHSKAASSTVLLMSPQDLEPACEHAVQPANADGVRPGVLHWLRHASNRCAHTPVAAQ
jgi:hypothetical protein